MEIGDSSLHNRNKENESSFKIYITSSNALGNEASESIRNTSSHGVHCIRCSNEMGDLPSVFITIYPILQPKSYKSGSKSAVGSVSSKSSLPSSFHLESNSPNKDDEKRSSCTNHDCNNSHSLRRCNDEKLSDLSCYSSDSNSPDEVNDNTLLRCIGHNSSSTSTDGSETFISCIHRYLSDSSANGNKSLMNEAKLDPGSFPLSQVPFLLEDAHHTSRSCHDESDDDNSTDMISDDILSDNDIRGSQSGGDSIDNADRETYSLKHRILFTPKMVSHGEMGSQFEIITDRSDSPCTDCHIAVLNDSRYSCDGSREICSIILQVSNIPQCKQPKKVELECAVSSEADISVNAFEVYPEIIIDAVSDSGEKLPGSKGYDHQLPDLNAEAEAAYQSHLRNLVPCEFCKRTFNPDRVMVHENACIERRQTSRHPGGKNVST